MTKVLNINAITGIESRSSVGTPDHPAVNQEKPPSIAELHRIFISDGVPMAISAAKKAMTEAKIDPRSITHMVSTTCTDSANPGYDYFVAKELGLSDNVQRSLISGVGCSGGLATLRTGAQLALGHTAMGRPARVLCVALEVSTTMVRSELDSINELQETRIGACLFSDCASAVVLSNGIGEPTEPVYELLGWNHMTIPDTKDDLGFDVDPIGKFRQENGGKHGRPKADKGNVGWKVVLSPRVPKLTTAVIGPAFQDLLVSLPDLPPSYSSAVDFDWAMHPGGATILSGAERAMGIQPEHMRASYDRYMNHGNSSSATIFSVMDRLRSKDMDAMSPGGRLRDYVVGCAFGPGITVDMCMLKRNLEHGKRVSGLATPPETESETETSEDGEGSTGRDGENFISEVLDNLELD